MASPFLTAEWRNLLMANYVIDPVHLKKFLPARTELDEFNGVHYVSLVGFLFANTKVLGLPIPYHRNFEEVNLRFYVRYREDNKWKRGVVFMKEIVPRRMISLVANTFYEEKYATHSMYHKWAMEPGGFRVEYHWKVGRNWNFIKALAEPKPEPLTRGSEEEFITEHYWGYTQIGPSRTGVYEVAHPAWNILRVKEHQVHCDTEKLYGPQFAEALAQPPRSVFLAEGSPIKVMKGSKIIIS